MSEGVIAYLVAFGYLALQQVRVSLAVQTDDEKSGRHVLLLQHVEDLRSPIRVRSVIKGDGKLARGSTIARDDVRRREVLAVHHLRGDHSARRIELNRALAFR